MRPEIAAFGLAALVVICATVLAVTGHAIDPAFWVVAGAGAGGGAGATIPRPRPPAPPA